MKDHISFSQINTYLICPLKYRFQYIDRIQWPFVPSALLFGSCLHKALEHYYLGRKEDREVSSEELYSIFEGSWIKEQNGKAVFFNNSDTDKKLFETAGKLIKVFLKKTNSNKILAVEKDFQIELKSVETEEILSLPLKGKIDLIEKEPDETIILIDHKTAAKKYTKDKISQDMQMTCYSYVMYHYKMYEKSNVKLRFDVFLKNKNPDIIPYYTERTPEDFNNLFFVAKNVLRGIENNIFFPNKNYFCGDCVFKEPCKNWRG